LKYLVSFLLICICCLSSAQKPLDGTYLYKIAWEEHNKKSLGATCLVVVKGDSIKVIHDGNNSMTGKKGDIIDQGIILKHNATGKWIIGHSKADTNAKEIGGCSSGPTVIDFKRKIWFGC
jgi:hypothetical protein